MYFLRLTEKLGKPVAFAQYWRVAIVAVAFSVLPACSVTQVDAGRAAGYLQISKAWVDGRQVEYITTDISDAAMAKAGGHNYVPRLAQAVGSRPSILERVYKFAGDTQISIFQSAPLPVGASNQDKNYSPLWRMVLVEWKPAVQRIELKSEADVLMAEDKGFITVTVTDIVVNCPITGEVNAAQLSF